MKKVLIAMVASFSLCAYAHAKPQQEDHMTIKIDKTFKITLPSNPTTGYGWIVRSLPANIALTGMEYNQSPDCGKRVGCGGHETLYFKATEIGTGKLFLQYAQPFNQLPNTGETKNITVIK